MAVFKGREFRVYTRNVGEHFCTVKNRQCNVRALTPTPMLEHAETFEMPGKAHSGVYKIQKKYKKNIYPKSPPPLSVCAVRVLLFVNVSVADRSLKIRTQLDLRTARSAGIASVAMCLHAVSLAGDASLSRENCGTLKKNMSIAVSPLPAQRTLSQ